MKRTGPRTELCWTLDVTYVMSDRAMLTETLFAVGQNRFDPVLCVSSDYVGGRF